MLTVRSWNKSPEGLKSSSSERASEVTMSWLPFMRERLKLVQWARPESPGKRHVAMGVSPTSYKFRCCRRGGFSSLIQDSHYCPPATYDTLVLSRRSLPQVPDGHAVSSWSARHPCERRKRRGPAFPYQGRDILPHESKFPFGSSCSYLFLYLCTIYRQCIPFSPLPSP